MEETVIYGDVLFLINLLTDGLCLAVTALLMGAPFVLWRFALGCVLGGLYSLAALPIGELNAAFAPVFHSAAALIICFTALPSHGIKSVLTNSLCFFITSALLGGVLCAVFTLCGDYAFYNGALYTELSAAGLIGSAVVTAAMLCFCILRHKGRSSGRHGSLRIYFRGKRCTLFCLADSGNLACCPFTGLPVVIAKASRLYDLFEPEELRAYKDTPVASDIRPLPLSGIGGERLFPSFTAEKAEAKLMGDRGYREVRLCVAVDFDGDSYGGCDAVAPWNVF